MIAASHLAEVLACVYQANKPASGGAREGGNREASASVEVTFLSGWVRIFSITTGPLMQAHDPDGATACPTGFNVNVE